MKSVQIRGLDTIITWKLNLGRVAPVETSNDCLVSWPEKKLGPVPDDATLQQWAAEYAALPMTDKDPRLKLISEIQAATTIAQLKLLLVRVIQRG